MGDLCRSCVAETGVDGGGVALVSTQGVREVLFVTDPVADALETAQLSLGEGPCIDAVESRRPVLVDDLHDPARGAMRRWPFFTADVAAHGIRSVFAFPIRLGAVPVGTLELYRRGPGALQPPELGSALSAAEHIGGALLTGGEAGAALDHETGLVHELASDHGTAPIVQVHQAAGMVMVQAGLSSEEAMALLRATAFAEDISLTDLARDVVERRRRFERQDLP